MKIQLDPEGYQPPKAGLALLQVLAALLFFIFVIRFWYLQIHRGDDFARQALNNRLRTERVYALRGLIRDVHGTILAENRPAFGLALVREDCQDVDATLAQVSSWLDVPLDQLTARYRKDIRKVKPFEPVLLANDMSFDLVARVEARLLYWPGLEIVTRSRRHYPQREDFAHILGYVAEANEKEMAEDDYLSLGDNVGKQGLEFVLEHQLRGQKGQYSVEVDVLGRALGKSLDEAPQNGENVQLCLDAELQQRIVAILGERTGSVVVMEPKSGRLRALVTTPAYDNNLFVGGLSQKTWTELRDNPRHPLQNRGIQSVYPPGSVWKLMMAGLFLHEGISPSAYVSCSGAVSLGSHVFRCWRKHGHGAMNMLHSLMQSCDVYYYQLGERMGVDRIEKFAKACGFGEPTGIDLPHEKAGLVPSRAWKRQRTGEGWYRGETLNISIGQGSTLVTPLQIATFVSALMNGGKLMKPLLLEGQEPTVRREIPINAKGREFILNGMRLTAEQGTARVLRRSDAVIGGKTGTAQVVKIKMVGERRQRTEEMEYLERDHAWIASWGKRGDEEVVVVVMLEHAGGGSSQAGPVARKVYDILYNAIPRDFVGPPRPRVEGDQGRQI